MEWFDACSLLLCQNRIPPEKRTAEISHGPDGIKYLLFQTAADTLSISPWPFQLNQFMVQFETRSIPDMQFVDSAAFRKAFLKVKVKEVFWKFKKAKPSIQPKTKNI